MRFVRKQLLIYVAVGLVVIAVGARYLLTDRSDGSGTGGDAVALTAPSPQPSADAANTSSPSPMEVVVDVCGAVARPGVYRLSPDARVCDAVEMAGGATGRAELSAVNLAARLVDGQQIVIPERGRAAAGGSGSAVAQAGETAGAAGGSGEGGTAAAAVVGAPVNLNTATLEQLDALTGVGPATAQKIIDYRDANGGFTSVEQLLDVPGIGDAKFAALKDAVTI